MVAAVWRRQQSRIQPCGRAHCEPLNPWHPCLCCGPHAVAPKAPPKKTPTPAKKKKAVAADEAGGSGSKPTPKRGKAPKPPTEVTTLDDGWTLHPPFFIYK